MKKFLTFLTLLTVIAPAIAQTTIDVPLSSEAWALDGTGAEFTIYRGEKALRLHDGKGRAIQRVVTNFQDGTIEYDIAFTDSTRFASVYFRPVDLRNYEHVYLRVMRRDILANDHIQYAAVTDNANLWDLRPEYQSNAPLRYEGWNHVRIVVKDKQLLAYVNDMETPALYVPMMDGERTAGEVAFDGEVYLKNVRISPDQTPGLGDVPAYDLTDNDPRYLRRWEVSRPEELPVATEPVTLPDEQTNWEIIEAEHLGLVNLSRAFGETPYGQQRVVWLRTTLAAEEAQMRRLDLGFSDGVYLYLNGGLLGLDRTVYQTPGMTEPEGRLSLDNSSWNLPLQAGENELLIAVTNFFYGWGIVARLDNARGLTYGTLSDPQ